MGQVPAWLTAPQAIGTAMFRSWTVTFATWREGVWIKRECKKNPNGRMGEPVSPRTQKKKFTNSQIGFGLNKKLCACCSELSHGAFSLLAAGSCNHNCMGLNPISHFVVRSPFSSHMHMKSPQQAAGHKNNNNSKQNKKCKQVVSASYLMTSLSSSNTVAKAKWKNVQIFTEAPRWNRRQV